LTTPIDPNAVNDVGTATVAVAASNVADISTSMTASASSVTAGSPLTWTITIANAGPAGVTGALVSDVFPHGYVGVAWTCTAAAGSSCSAATGTSDIGITVDLAAGGVVTFVVNGTVDSSAAGSLVNTAFVTPPAGVVDPSPADQKATIAVPVSTPGPEPPTPSPPSPPSPPEPPPPAPPAPPFRAPGCDVDGDGLPDIVTAAGPGAEPRVRVFTLVGGNVVERASFDAFEPEFRGGVSVACGNVTGDNVAEIVTGAGPAAEPRVRVWRIGPDGGATLIVEFNADEASFTGGITVAVGDVTGDGVADIITGSGAGGEPKVYVFALNGGDARMLATFDAYDADFRGGVFVAAADVTGDGIADIVTGSGRGARPIVRVFGYNGGAIINLSTFFPYDAGVSGGATVAAADLTGDGIAEIVTGAGPGATPDVRIFSLGTGSAAQVDGFPAYDRSMTAGVYVAAGDVTGGGTSEIVTGTGPGASPLVRIVRTNGAERASFYAFDPASTSGVRVAAGSDGGGLSATTPRDPRTKKPTAPDGRDALPPQLNPGDGIRSTDGRFRLIYQGDGNLVLYDENGTALWSSGTAGVQPGRAVMQGDGNLVIYNAAGEAVWSSGTAEHPGARLIVQRDGNVVIYDSADVALWWTGTVQPVAGTPPGPAPSGGGTGGGTPSGDAPSNGPGQGGAGVLSPGATLNPGGAVTSDDGRYSLVYQADGNLVLYAQGAARWSSRTDGTTPGVVAMQGDGNLVVYDSNGTPVWASRTDGHPDAQLFVQSDGNVVIYENGGRAIWSTNTAGR